MGRIISKTIYCANSKGRYLAYFEEKTPGQWVGIKSERLPDMSFFEKKRLKSKMQHKNKPSIFKSISLININIAPIKSDADVNGEFFSGTLKCPNCGNTNFIKCNVCGELTCARQKETHFTCAVCGNSGPVSGTITNLNGNVNRNNNDKSATGDFALKSKNKKF
ncbi:MAG: hypothetical protein IJQ07_06705 [Clostridia bacterium]|nr:hypothetical protein [Clostridia bacterium]